MLNCDWIFRKHPQRVSNHFTFMHLNCNNMRVWTKKKHRVCDAYMNWMANLHYNILIVISVRKKTAHHRHRHPSFSFISLSKFFEPFFLLVDIFVSLYSLSTFYEATGGRWIYYKRMHRKGDWKNHFESILFKFILHLSFFSCFWSRKSL